MMANLPVTFQEICREFFALFGETIKADLKFHQHFGHEKGILGEKKHNIYCVTSTVPDLIISAFVTLAKFALSDLM